MDNREAPVPPGPRRQRRLAAKYRRRRTFVAMAAVLIIGAPVTVAAAVHNLGANISSSPLRAHDGDVPEKLGDESNILIIGSDTRDLASTKDGSGDSDPNADGDGGAASGQGFGSAEGARSDAMILAHVSADASRIDAVQIPRDTIMDIPACNDTGHGASEAMHGMINSALNAGPACSVSAAEVLTGMRVDHFINVDFDGFAAIVDALDGITVDLDEPLKDPKANLDLPAGEQTLRGDDALALARTRHAVGDGSDIARMGNQQMVMEAIIDRAKSGQVLTRPDRLYGFLDAVTSTLGVDDELNSVKALASMATTVASVDKDDITFEIMPWAPAPENPNRVVKSADADAVFSAINADEPITDALD
ncbi:cell envelope-related function transcriptional attenuator common domain-containing protein [Brevibacterium siliguriense]|uniref:Cell envelope-related function transcriptional attenuator common domain-containing protein n=1 Tax=Brevibacterium siliguriense TaxID=1136497 RepID=A0A1H1MY95_9MICO|nr:LCP family protein [Brevibacterium siliguriense]SDR91841.1 cell envelope-related function transcriptional attenuator common domain-containing protein [Brevibacterium siliguriense]